MVIIDISLSSGRVEETEFFPHPPPDNNGEHRWLHSEMYVLLKASVESLKKSYTGADALGELCLSVCMGYIYILQQQQ